MGFLVPKTPHIAPPPPPPTPTTMNNPQVSQSAAQVAAAAAAAEGGGFNDMEQSGPQGAPTPALAKQALGQ